MNDFFNRALEQAKQVQAQVAEAMTKSAQQAQPLFADAVVKAGELQKQMITHAVDASAAAQPHLDALRNEVSKVAETGKAALDAGIANAQPLVAQMGEHSKKMVDAATAAVTNATKPPPSQP